MKQIPKSYKIVRLVLDEDKDFIIYSCSVCWPSVFVYSLRIDLKLVKTGTHECVLVKPHWLPKRIKGQCVRHKYWLKFGCSIHSTFT